ncbi:MAG: hypothetical protein H6611_00005, partial [Ignavibacteriales bacterium]|nr:hypothetical protein [Ignavibacteriales bacterium]
MYSAKNLSKLSALHVKLGDLSTIYQNVNIFKEILNDISITVYNKDDQIIYKTELPTSPGDQFIRVNINYGGTYVGKITLRYKRIKYNFKNRDYILLGIVSITIFILLLLVYIILYRKSFDIQRLLNCLTLLDIDNTRNIDVQNEKIDNDIKDIYLKINKFILYRLEAISNAESAKSSQALYQLSK